jgi:hypothetical protein
MGLNAQFKFYRAFLNKGFKARFKLANERLTHFVALADYAYAFKSFANMIKGETQLWDFSFAVEEIVTKDFSLGLKLTNFFVKIRFMNLSWFALLTFGDFC